jgi:4-hydroxybenzoate polyprenyltransferase
MPINDTAPVRASTLSVALRAMRVHQWVKNLLLLVPLMLAHRLNEPGTLALAVVAFVAFSLASSSAYLFNDLLDVEADRAHPTKSRRPLAAGELTRGGAVTLAAALLIGALVISAVMLPMAFAAMVAGYVALALAYSVWLKQRIVIDVLVLAGLYAYRLLSGAVAVDVWVSQWLVAFSMFLFLSLALVKRYAELDRAARAGETAANGRGYQADDLALFRVIGPASGYLAVVVFAMYISSDHAESIYATPVVLWLVCPLLLYWLTRVWFITHRGQMSDDPIPFALKDPASYIVGGLIFLVAAVAATPPQTWPGLSAGP